MKTKLKSFLMLFAVVLLVPQGVNARQFEYDFAALGEKARNQFNNDGPYTINMGNKYPSSVFTVNYGASTTFTDNDGPFTVDFSKFAFRMDVNNQKGWLLYGSGSQKGFDFIVCDLRPDDEVTIYFHTTASNRTATLYYESGSATQNGNDLTTAGTVMGSTSSTSDQSITFTAKNGGDVCLYANSQSYYTVIAKIVINRPDVASYDYSPTNYEVYDIFYSGSGTTYETANAGFQLNNSEAVYLKNLSSGLELNNRVAVSQSSLGTDQWIIDQGVKARWSWHNVSICNLKAGDRVRIYFTGEAVFSSKGNYSTYNGSPAFVDYYNDGIKNNGEFDTTDEGDRTITGGTPVAVSVSGWHGALNQEFKTSEVYVMEEDGHLDIGLNGTADNEKGSRIVKIEIYSDHPAMMVDKYNGSSTTGYTSYFDVTGQLQGKEHIMPGGLEIQFGNESEEQYAIVTLTDEGPASFVYDQNRYKPARITNDWTKFTVSEAYPAYGTYYKFIPQVSGTMSLKFKAFSINYRDYNKNGDVAIDQNGTPNEEARPNVSCPYYLMEQTSGSTTPSQKMTATYGHGATSDATFTNITVEAGKTYWLYGWWSNGSASNNFSDGSHAAGVAELVEVTFVPNNMVYPLAKWVANGTTSDDYLASVSGTTVTVKKKSANILSCTPIIEGGMLKISGITYAQGADQGGTILLKVGDPNNDDDPVFALTIAYDASKGHTWNFSDNPLKGLKWTNKNTEADVVDFGTETGPGLLYDEMHEANGHSDWTKTYRVKKGDTKYDLMFLNKYDMEGDNADMMWDTEGLIINTSSNQSCINNEHGAAIDHSNKTQADPDRYVGILPGGEFIIPKLEADDRVIVDMGSGHGSGTAAMRFNITGANDALNNEIVSTDEYYAGGSMWNVPDGHNDPYYRGCYHFIARGGDMKFKMVGGSMCKLYSIEIYRGDRRHTNGVQGNNGYMLLSSEGDTSGQTVSWNLHYRGKGEELANGTGRYSQVNEVIAHTKAVTNTTLTTNGNTVSYTNTPGDIGMLRIRVKCMEYNKNYVTDFEDRNITVAYHQAMSYPYTWDFVDIKAFSGTDVAAETTAYVETTDKTEPKGYDLSVWDADGKMILDSEVPNGADNHNFIFENGKYINGNQLYANDKIIPETKGLWFYFDNNDPAYNGCMQIAADGLHLANASYENNASCEQGVSMRRGWWNYKMVVPSVPAGAAVYLRMARDMSVKEGDISFHPWSPTNNAFVDVTEPFFYKKFQFGWMNTKAEMGTEQTEICKYYQASDGTGDYIVAIKNSGATSNLTFTLNGWILKKLSISTDEKTVNKYGWNTESREHAIDPSLLSYMTGKDFRSYIVTAANEATNTVTLARIDGGSGADGDNTSSNPNMKLIVPGATTKGENEEVVADNGSINAYIIRNAGGAAVDMFGENSGFHLFVPDMHDSPSIIPSTNLLKARVTATSTSNNDIVNRDETEIKTENDETTTTITANNYAFTYIYKKVNDEGVPYTGPKEGKQAFYRIVYGGAQSLGHQAYLSIPVQTEEPVQEGGASRSLVATTSQPAESYNIVFQEWNNIESLKGDVNGDGRFNKLDVNTTADYVAGRPAGIFKGLADMNNDGRVDIIDLTLMIQKISGE